MALGYSRRIKPLKAKQCEVTNLDEFRDAMGYFYSAMNEYTDSIEEIEKGLSYIVNLDSEKFASTALLSGRRELFDSEDCLCAWEIMQQYF